MFLLLSSVQSNLTVDNLFFRKKVKYILAFKDRAGPLFLKFLCTVLCLKDGEVVWSLNSQSFHNASQRIIFVLLEIMTTYDYIEIVFSEQ